MLAVLHKLFLDLLTMKTKFVDTGLRVFDENQIIVCLLMRI